MSFHRRCGSRIHLTNLNRTARRNINDFNHGIVLSAEPMTDDVWFQVRIDEKTQAWNGTMEIGVTCVNPETTDFPSCAQKLTNGTWIWSGADILKDGQCILECYGGSLDVLNEGDCVGIMRTSDGNLIFSVNGESKGIAATGLNVKPIWAVVSLYGKCTQVSICTDLEHSSSCATVAASAAAVAMASANYDIESFIPNFQETISTTSVSALNSFIGERRTEEYMLSGRITNGALLDNDRLHFHVRCGSLVNLSANNRTAERRRPLDEFNNGVVMTHRPLRDNELFEIRIDKLVDKWSGSIEVGVTTHNPNALHFPATMTNMRSGTIMMSGCGILTNGKGTRREYGEFNLDELREGDRVGMMRKSNGSLHYYINGQDQGVAAKQVAQTLWGVIDLYGMTIKVTIVDRDEREQQNLVTRRNNIISSMQTCVEDMPIYSPDTDYVHNSDRLTFHPVCGSHVTVTQSGRTALRPSASDDFNNGVVLTRRPLRPNELFQVRLERVVSKWAGSIEIGITEHSPTELDFPFTMTNVRTGTWMMTGNGVMHNGITVVEQYGLSLDRLQAGDRVGVMRKDDGTLHFWVNGIDQGPAATNVPEKVYGVVDLYGQAAQCSIVDDGVETVISPEAGNSTFSNTTLNGGMCNEQKLRFHACHGPNARILNQGLTASRPKALAEFNGSIVFSNRPLRQRELFEVVLETMIDHWNGSVEIGVTGTLPDEISFASATDLEQDTVMVSGQTLIHNGRTVRNDMSFNLDNLTSGSRVGVMRNGDAIHFFVNGVDQGPAYDCPTQNMYAVIDLYGQCAQVSIVNSMQTSTRAPYAISENSQSIQAASVIAPVTEVKHRWSCISGSVSLFQNWTLASRCTSCNQPALTRCLVFSEHFLVVGEPFEIKITEYNSMLAGCLKIGVTDLNLSDEHVRKNLPVSMKRIPSNVWYVSGNEIRYNTMLLKRSMASLEWLRIGDRITLELTSAQNLRVLLNSEDMNISFSNVAPDVYAVVELQGPVMAVQIISMQVPMSPLRPCSLRLQDSLDLGLDPLKNQDSMLESIDSETPYFEFSDIHGRNIQLIDDRRIAQRLQSYNQAIVCIAKPLCKGHSISIKIDEINTKWKGTIILGAVSNFLNTMHLPSSAILLRRPCWIITHDYINLNGSRMQSKLGEALLRIQKDTIITLTLTHSGSLNLNIANGQPGRKPSVSNTHNTNETQAASSTDWKFNEEIATGLPHHVYPILDLYGKCERISLVCPDVRNGSPINEEVISSSIHNESDRNVPQLEKADLEVHEKETDNVQPSLENDCRNRQASGNMSMNRSVADSVSKNLLHNLSIRTAGTKSEQGESSTACFLRDSLQLQHSTNLNIQRSQSTSRFCGVLNTNFAAADDMYSHADSVSNYDDNNIPATSTSASAASASASASDSNYIFSATTDNEININWCPQLNQPPPFAQSATLYKDPNYNQITVMNDNESNQCSSGDYQNSLENARAQQFNANEAFASTTMSINDQNRERSHPNSSSLSMERCSIDTTQQRLNSITSEFDTIPSIENKDCEYLKLVMTFKRTLVLPDVFFSYDMVICYCALCLSNSGRNLLEGWVRFKLSHMVTNVSSSSASESLDCSNSDWTTAYYMSRVDKIRAILDHGQPLPIEQCEYVNGNQKDDSGPGTLLLLFSTPNSQHQLPSSTFVHRSGSTSYRIDVSFEVRVRTQAVCVADASINLNDNEPIATNGQPVSVWTTKEAGACVLSALLLKLTPETVAPAKHST